MTTILLDSPFGTIRCRFHNATQCGVSLVDPGPIVVNNVKVEGVLQFALTNHTWGYLKYESYVDRADNHKSASEAIQNKLATTATDLLNEWYQANPEAFKAVQRELLEAKLREEEAELERLVDRTKKQSAVVADLRQQLEAVT